MRTDLHRVLDKYKEEGHPMDVMLAREIEETMSRFDCTVKMVTVLNKLEPE